MRNLESNALILVRRQALADVSLCFSCVCCSLRAARHVVSAAYCDVSTALSHASGAGLPKLTQACTSTCVPQEGLLNEVVYPLLTVQVGNTTSMRERFSMSVFLFTGVYAALHLHAFGWGKP